MTIIIVQIIKFVSWKDLEVIINMTFMLFDEWLDSIHCVRLYKKNIHYTYGKYRKNLKAFWKLAQWTSKNSIVHKYGTDKPILKNLTSSRVRISASALKSMLEMVDGHLKKNEQTMQIREEWIFQAKQFRVNVTIIIHERR